MIEMKIQKNWNTTYPILAKFFWWTPILLHGAQRQPQQARPAQHRAVPAQHITHGMQHIFC